VLHVVEPNGNTLFLLRHFTLVNLIVAKFMPIVAKFNAKIIFYSRASASSPLQAQLLSETLGYDASSCLALS